MSFRNSKRSIAFLIFSLFFCACTAKDQEDFLNSGESLIKAISFELACIEKEEDFKIYKTSLRKKLRALTKLMILAEDYQRKQEIERIDPIVSSIWSDKLYYEILRICQDIEGGKLFLEELQHDMLDRLDVDIRKHQKQTHYRFKK